MGWFHQHLCFCHRCSREVASAGVWTPCLSELSGPTPWSKALCQPFFARPPSTFTKTPWTWLRRMQSWRSTNCRPYRASNRSCLMEPCTWWLEWTNLLSQVIAASHFYKTIIYDFNKLFNNCFRVWVWPSDCRRYGARAVCLPSSRNVFQYQKLFPHCVDGAEHQHGWGLWQDSRVLSDSLPCASNQQAFEDGDGKLWRQRQHDCLLLLCLVVGWSLRRQLLGWRGWGARRLSKAERNHLGHSKNQSLSLNGGFLVLRASL